MHRKLLIAGVSAVCLGGLATPALAQTAAAAKPAQPAVVDEVMVTAQRRSERAIDVPQTVNLVSSARLEKAGITDAMSLSQVVPGLIIAPQGLAVQPTIRGVGTTITPPGTSGTVAAYIDGVYQIAQGAYNFELNNLEKVEVLKGPQGTLYGRNATGGVILITTKAPSFDTYGKMQVGYGNLNTRTADVFLNGGITQNLAGNLSLNYRAADGYFHDIGRNRRVGDNERYGLRGKLLYKLSDDATLTLGVTHSFTNDPTTFESAPINGNTLARKTPGIPIPTRPFDVTLTFDPYVKNMYNQVSLTGDFDFDKVHINTITAGNSNHEKIFADPDFSPLPTSIAFQQVNESVVSQEITASSNGTGRLRWIGGLMYVHSEGDYDPYVSVLTSVIRTSTINDSYSGFLEFTYNLTDRLKVVAGTRYTKEDQNYSGSRNGAAVAKASLETGKWTPRLSVNYKVTDASSIYATYSKGFRSGGWNASILSNTGYQPEYVTAYEVGAKSSMGRANFSAAAFYYDFSNIQFSASTTTVAGGSTTTIVNAAAAKIYGLEGSADFYVTPAFLVQAGFSYTHSEYTHFPNAIVTLPTGLGGNTQFVADVSGNQMIRTPKVTANLGGTYTWDTDAGPIALSGNATYTSSLFRDAFNRLKEPSHLLENARVSFKPAGRPYEFTAWVKNISDERYGLYAIDSSLGDRITWAPPRTYGVTLGVNF